MCQLPARSARHCSLSRGRNCRLTHCLSAGKLKPVVRHHWVASRHSRVNRLGGQASLGKQRVKPVHPRMCHAQQQTRELHPVLHYRGYCYRFRCHCVYQLHRHHRCCKPRRQDHCHSPDSPSCRFSKSQQAPQASERRNIYIYRICGTHCPLAHRPSPLFRARKPVVGPEAELRRNQGEHLDTSRVVTTVLVMRFRTLQILEW